MMRRFLILVFLFLLLPSCSGLLDKAIRDRVHGKYVRSQYDLSSSIDTDYKTFSVVTEPKFYASPKKISDGLIRYSLTNFGTFSGNEKNLKRIIDAARKGLLEMGAAVIYLIRSNDQTAMVQLVYRGTHNHLEVIVNENGSMVTNVVDLNKADTQLKE